MSDIAALGCLSRRKLAPVGDEQIAESIIPIGHGGRLHVSEPDVTKAGSNALPPNVMNAPPANVQCQRLPSLDTTTNGELYRLVVPGALPGLLAFSTSFV